MPMGYANARTLAAARAARGPLSVSVAVLALFALGGCAPDLGEAPRVQPPTAYADAKSFAAPKADWPRTLGGRPMATLSSTS